MTSPVVLCAVEMFANGKRQDAVGHCTVIGSKQRVIVTLGILSRLEAEFRIVRHALRKAKTQQVEGVTVVMDSPDVVEAMAGKRIIRDERIAPLVQECIGLMIVTHSKVVQTLPQEVIA